MIHSKPVIKAVSLTKEFGSFKAVDGLSLEVNRGEILGFLGPNGAGKTTSISMICGLLKPTNGEVYIFGQLIKNQKRIKNQIGVCPQDTIFWPKLTCIEQLEFLGQMYGMTKKQAHKRSHFLLERIGLLEKMNALGSKLSGGMKRKLNLCLAIIHDPEIIILDEPEAGLDPQSRVLIREFILSMAKSKTVILTTHNMDEADRLADRVAIIDHGKLLTVGTPEEIKNSAGGGDILEIELMGKPDINTKVLSLILAGYQFDLMGDTLSIEGKEIINAIPDIIEKLKSSDLIIGKMQVRKRSLEDVFIQLTGRSLRA